MMDWDTYFMGIAKSVSFKSKDPSTQTGVVLVGPGHEVKTTGYNGFPRGIEDGPGPRWERPEKYMWCEHAERNAVYNAARMGIALLGTTCYMESPPCVECARALIQSGVYCVVMNKNNPFVGRDDWAESLEFATNLMVEAGMLVRWWEGSIPVTE